MFQNLYIHVPFCLNKCDYCAFYSLPSADLNLQQKWLEMIQFQIKLHESELQNLNTIYFGGGTPSSLPCPLMEDLFQIIKNHTSLQQDAEISMEANPETITAEKANVILSFVNRVSMGVQSFSKKKLSVLGRHSAAPEFVETAVNHFRNAGLKNLGFDLIYAVPGEKEELWESDLHHALDLQPDHISCYSLIPEDGTPLMKRSLPPFPDDMLSRKFWDMTQKILSFAGMPRYEISNYAKAAFEARHNQNVWHGQTYLGIGPAAASFDGIDRWTECADLHQWLAGTPPEKDQIPRAERRAEIFFMGLRTVRGWTRPEYAAVTGQDWNEFHQKLCGLKERHLLTEEDETIRPTTEGLAFWNEIALELL